MKKANPICTAERMLLYISIITNQKYLKCTLVMIFKLLRYIQFPFLQQTAIKKKDYRITFKKEEEEDLLKLDSTAQIYFGKLLHDNKKVDVLNTGLLLLCPCLSWTIYEFIMKNNIISR